MPDISELSRRQRQIMDVVFARGEATVNQVVAGLPNPPTAMAVRRMMHVLEERGYLKRHREGREVVYVPTRSQSGAGASALQHVLDTFFGGSLKDALAVHLSQRKKLSAEELKEAQALIAQARKEGR